MSKPSKRRCAAAIVLAAMSTVALGPGVSHVLLMQHSDAAPATLFSLEQFPPVADVLAQHIYPIQPAGPLSAPLENAAMPEMETSVQLTFAMAQDMLGPAVAMHTAVMVPAWAGTLGHSAGGYGGPAGTARLSLLPTQGSTPVSGLKAGSTVTLASGRQPGKEMENSGNTALEDLPLPHSNSFLPAAGNALEGLPASAADGSANPDGSSGPSTAVPEPATLLLLICGMLGMTASRRPFLHADRRRAPVA